MTGSALRRCYGRPGFRLLAELRRSERWNPERMAALQLERLRRVPLLGKRTPAAKLRGFRQDGG